MSLFQKHFHLFPFRAALMLVVAQVFFSACSSKLSRFDVLLMQNKSSSTHQILRSEVAAQGSGAASSGNFTLERVSIGGSYLRRVGSVQSAATQVDAGLNPGLRR